MVSFKLAINHVVWTSGNVPRILVERERERERERREREREEGERERERESGPCSARSGTRCKPLQATGDTEKTESTYGDRHFSSVKSGE